MREHNILRKMLPRMEWSPMNLFMLWRRSFGPEQADTTFTRTRQSLFQQRWKAKKLVRAYHGDHINEKIFKRWYLPSILPDVRPRRKAIDEADKDELARFARGEAKRLEEEDKKGLAPVGSLMLAEIERRIDVVIFRSCLAHSVYEARRLVVHGDVLLNGKKHQNANTRLAPGDMVSVDPQAIRFLHAPANSESGSAEENSLQATNEDTDDTSAPQKADESGTEGEAWKQSRYKKQQKELTLFRLPPYASPFIFIPAYLEVSFASCSAIYVRHPTARPGYSEIPTPYDADGEVIRLAWEWYSRIRPRIRSKKKLAGMPENRQVGSML